MFPKFENLQWRENTPQIKESHQTDELGAFLFSGGTTIESKNLNLFIETGSRALIHSGNPANLELFCDHLLGFKTVDNSNDITFTVGEETYTKIEDRKNKAAILGRSPFMVGETIQEALYYRAYNVKKMVLYYFLEKIYGPTLKAKTSPQNPLLDKNNKPIPTQTLTEKELLEISEINVMLSKLPLIVLDLTSVFMKRAMAQGYKPSKELLNSGKTILVLCEDALPADTDLITTIEVNLGTRLTSSLKI